MCFRQTGMMCVFRCVCVLLCVCVCVCLNLLDEAVMFSGPTGSLFGFSVDFHTISNKSFVVIGAPKANTSQSGVTEGGSVFLCPCYSSFKSQQWFGASVRSVSSSHLLACAPLFHWNVQMGEAESGKTPVGNCLLLDHRTGSSTSFSPCRGIMMEADYTRMKNSKKLSSCLHLLRLQSEGRLVLGAPGSFYFQGEWRDLLVTDGKYTWLKMNVYYITVIYQFYTRELTHFVFTTLMSCDKTDQIKSNFTCLHTVSMFPVRYAHLLLLLLQVVVYLQRKYTSFTSRPDQSLIGSSLYGRFGSALAVLGDLDMDGYQDVAVGAPWSGDSGQGQVFIYLGNSNGLSATPFQVIDSPLPCSRTAFGFTLRGRADIDGNGYPDLLVGAWAADRAFVYRSQAVIRSRVSLTLLPDFLNPDVKLCHQGNTPVSCFVIQMCVYVSGHRIPQETALGVELQLDQMKQLMARRTLLLSTNQPQDTMKLVVQREVGKTCMNQTAYLREVQDKLSPIFITVNISLLNTTQHALLHGQTHTAAQTRIILDCGNDNICVPDLNLAARTGVLRVLVGEDQSVLLAVLAENEGEGAYETELVVRVPEHTHFQSSQVNTHTCTHTLVCVQRKENQTIVVTCDLGNPMTQGHTTGLLFSVGHLEEVESHIGFTLRIRSKNSVNSSSNQVTVRIQVRAEATLEIRGGSSPPEVVLPLPDWQPAMHPGSLEVGPLVEHVYELRNYGPSAVNARLTVDFPSSWRHHFLLYIFSNATEESLSCWTLNASQIDPFKLVENSSDVSVVSPSVQQEETNSHRQTVHVVKKNFCTHTQVVMMSGHTQVSVLWRPPDGEKEVPIGYIVLSIISGLLLLGLFCFIFWKLGFFQRTRPPTDDDEGEDEEQQLAEESHMTE
uniref:Uncharacterized protein n=1 Tax=Lates calcarifer TaxID=8187 RepID=A0A4W6EZD6_LATCA